MRPCHHTDLCVAPVLCVLSTAVQLSNIAMFVICRRLRQPLPSWNLESKGASSGASSLFKEGLDGSTREISSDLDPAPFLGAAPTSGTLGSNQGIPEHDEATSGSKQGTPRSGQGIPERFEDTSESHEAIPGSNKGKLCCCTRGCPAVCPCHFARQGK